MRLGSGESLDDILSSTDEVAEGVATSRAIAQLLEMRGQRTRARNRAPTRTRAPTPTPTQPPPQPQPEPEPQPQAPPRAVRGYRRDLKFPILLGVAAILDGKLTPRQGLEKLMQYPLRLEDFDAPKRSSEFR